MPCHKVFGYCLRGCKQNFQPPLCNECVDGFHGEDCQSACDYCNKSSPGCRQSDGHCLNGCESNINIDKCKVETPEPIEKNESSTAGDGSSNIAFYAAIASLVVIQAITVSIVIYQRRRMSDLLRTKHLTEDIKCQRQTTTTNYDNLAFAEESHEYVSIDSTTRY
uniref:Uncharacterized protein LOC111115510 n=1 Tax=Crassostrea virginica TaxID=6565 RepID=A0A8B8C2T2_CRAVI|nr:uncharacterized protein LOC111115510 [Crassostrea virginica]